MSRTHVHFPSRALPIEFAVWPARSLFSAQFLMCTEDRLPGLPDWIERTRQQLPITLQENLVLLNALGAVQKLVDEQLLAGRQGDDVPSFLEWIEGFDPAHLQRLVQHTRYESFEEAKQISRQVSLGLTDASADWEGIPLSDEGWKRLRGLWEDGRELLCMAHQVLDLFWSEFLHAEYASRSAELGRVSQIGNASFTAPLTLDDLLHRLIGRRESSERPSAALATRIMAVPVLHLGPYARSSLVDLSSPVMLVEFEAARFLTQKRDPDGELAASVFRALGDPSRLRIVRYLRSGERFGGEIVEHSGLSQATVSGHLRLLVAERIVLVRREGNTKYYALNHPFLAQLGTAIARFADSV